MRRSEPLSTAARVKLAVTRNTPCPANAACSLICAFELTGLVLSAGQMLDDAVGRRHRPGHVVRTRQERKPCQVLQRARLVLRRPAPPNAICFYMERRS